MALTSGDRPRDLPEEFARLGVDAPEGSSTKPGFLYHELPFARYRTTRVHRPGSTAARADMILGALEVEGLRGLDVGCSVGGITFRLQLAGADMVGIDYDPAAIDAARHVEELEQTGATFSTLEVGSWAFDELLAGEPFDFVVWLSQFMWLSKQLGAARARDVLAYVSERVPVLVFENAGAGDSMASPWSLCETQDDVRRLLEDVTSYSSIDELGEAPPAWGASRRLFLCRR